LLSLEGQQKITDEEKNKRQKNKEEKKLAADLAAQEASLLTVCLEKTAVRTLRRELLKVPSQQIHCSQFKLRVGWAEKSLSIVSKLVLTVRQSDLSKFKFQTESFFPR
jgi:hypothetical protein